MGKTADRHTLSDKIFGFLRDWLSQSKAEFRLIIENVRLRKEVAYLKREHDRFEAMTHRDVEEAKDKIARIKSEARVELEERDRVIVELRTQIAHLNDLLFECRGKSDAAERSTE